MYLISILLSIFGIYIRFQGKIDSISFAYTVYVFMYQNIVVISFYVVVSSMFYFHPYLGKWSNVKPPTSIIILRKFQQTPGTYHRYPNIQIWNDFLHTHLIEGLGYVPGVCSSFLRIIFPSKRFAHHVLFSSLQWLVRQVASHFFLQLR